MCKRRNSCVYPVIFSFLVAMGISAAAVGKIIYVDDDAGGANNGSSWADAYNYLQDALADANSAEKPVEIKVAQGVYTPDRGGGNVSGDMEAAFQLVNGVTIKGGYAGFSEPDPNARDIELYETVLSGDLNGDDAEVADPVDLMAEPSRFENSYHVVAGSGTDETAVMDGLTITAGNAEVVVSLFGGGGMYNAGGSPILIKCTFYANSAVVVEMGDGYLPSEGGGMLNCYGSSPKLTDCVFVGNSALTGGGMYNGFDSSPTLTGCAFVGNEAVWSGGGVANGDNSNSNFTNCTFSENLADVGGAMYNFWSSPILENCIFISNSASSGGGLMNSDWSNPTLTCCEFKKNFVINYGGGMDNSLDSSPIVTGCIFSGNLSSANGGGMANRNGGNPIVTNCVFTGNWAGMNGSGMYNNRESAPVLANCIFSGNFARSAGTFLSSDSEPFLTNCIFWGNTSLESPEIYLGNGSTAWITYSNIQGGSGSIRVIGEDTALMWGAGNIAVEPLFVEPGYWADVNDLDIIVDPDKLGAVWVDGDYHLKSEVGRWDPNSENWVQDEVTSPCVDAGDPNSDRGGEIWPHGGRINMGAYGGTRQASMSSKPQSLRLPKVAYIFSYDAEEAGSFEYLLKAYGCPVTLIRSEEVAQTTFDSYDVIVVGNDTGVSELWRGDDESVAAIENSGKPIVGLGSGGYSFFGKLGLSIGYPNGGTNDCNGIFFIVEPEQLLFGAPYVINVPEDGVLQLYSEAECVSIYLPSVPEDVIVLGEEVGGAGYYPLVLENRRYLLWGFTGSPENMTEASKKLFINSVVLNANIAWGAAVGN